MMSNDISTLRDECAALQARLTSPEKADDEILRQDIARIAAKMLALTTASEGETSPIPALLAKTADNGQAHSKLITALRDIAPELLVHADSSDSPPK